jgi:hypothetical protein
VKHSRPSCAQEEHQERVRRKLAREEFRKEQVRTAEPCPCWRRFPSSSATSPRGYFPNIVLTKYRGF